MAYQSFSETPIQNSVGIVNDFLVGCLGANNIEEAYDTFFANAKQWAICQLRDEGFPAEAIQNMLDNHEQCEDTPVYDSYYRLLNQFNRKVLTAAANSL